MEPKEPVRLVLCDDHCIVTDGLKRLLQDVPWVECVGTANSGQEAIFLLEHVPADMVIMDLTMPGMDGAETMGRIEAALAGDRGHYSNNERRDRRDTSPDGPRRRWLLVEELRA